MDADPRDQLIQELRELVRAQAERIAALEEKVSRLEREAFRAAAPFRRKEKQRKPPSDYGKPGRKPGHDASFRVVPEKVDEHIDVPLERCPNCGGAVEKLRPCVQHIEDLPPITPHVTRLTTCTACCPRCGPVRSTHPMQVSTARGSAGTHLGARALALAAWLNKALGLTVRKTARLLRIMCGLSLTPGGLTRAMERVGRRARALDQELASGLREQPVVNVDETGWWLGNTQAWLWVFATPERTVYRIEDGRNRGVIEQMLGADFKGVLVSDCLSAYEKLPYRMHKCYAHHLRALVAAREDASQEGRRRIDELVEWLKSIMRLVRLRRCIPPPDWEKGIIHQRGLLDQRLDPAGCDAATEKVVNRLRKRKSSLLTCMEVEGVDPTNNLAERQLRPAVVTRKLSWGHKSGRGAEAWQILASLAATTDQRRESFLDLILPKLRLEGR